MLDEEALRQLLRRLDRRSYKAYGELRGREYELRGVSLYIDHVQGDPFAAPSRLRVRHPFGAAGLPAELLETPVARIAFRDWIARRMRTVFGGKPARRPASSAARGFGHGARARPGRGGRIAGSGGSGRVSVDAGGQEILDRSAVVLDGEAVELRLMAGLPAAGRRILGDEAERLLADWIPEAALAGFELDDGACEDALRFGLAAERQHALREALDARGLVAFIEDGARLPRTSGIDDRPMREAVPFRSPDALRVHLELPQRLARRAAEDATGTPPGQDAARAVGMGIPRGVTLIVGGGYHGKSTLLHALERGVYNHVPGDGRDGVVCDGSAVKIRAEEGRRVADVDIEPFIRDLPLGRDTHHFDTEDASGSTSQAASVMEAIEVGARVLLLDEDSCATNFMTRDARMQALIAPEREPITPLVDRVRELYDDHGVSTVLVAGSSGDFFAVADTVIEMNAFAPQDRSDDARALAAADPTARRTEARHPFRLPRARVPVRASVAAARRGDRPPKISVRGRDQLRYGSEEVELRACDQLIDPSQTRSIARALEWISARDDELPIAALLDALEVELEAQGCDALRPTGWSPAGAHPGDLARARRFEIAAALNRLRSLRIHQ